MPVQYPTKNWSATLHSNKLKVQGQITLPTPGFTVTLAKKQPQGINPLILLLEMTVVPPKGIEPQHVVTEQISFEEHTTVNLTEVEILPEGKTIKVTHAASASS